jgi:hypothetical protein
MPQVRPAWRLALALALLATLAHLQNARAQADFTAAAERYPASAWLQRRLLSEAIAARDGAAVELRLNRLAAMGYAPAPDVIEAAAPLLADAASGRLNALFAANRAPQRNSRLFAEAPPALRLVEGVAYDGRRHRLFATTVVGRELVYRERGRWRAVPGLEAGSLAGVVVDPARRLLWAASGAGERTPSRAGAFRGLIALDLDTLQVVRRLPAPDEGSPSDLGIGPDGAVYASDASEGALYRARPGESALEVIVPGGRLNSPQGLAPSKDNHLLYVADYGLGVRIVDLATGDISLLSFDGPAMLDGVDGLVRHGDDLIAIQNGVEPRRIVRLVLNAEGRAISRIDVLERAHPEWGEPTLGFVDRDRFIYVADGQGERFGADGVLIGEAPLHANFIRVLPLRR